MRQVGMKDDFIILALDINGPAIFSVLAPVRHQRIGPRLLLPIGNQILKGAFQLRELPTQSFVFGNGRVFLALNFGPFHTVGVVPGTALIGNLVGASQILWKTIGEGYAREHRRIHRVVSS